MHLHIELQLVNTYYTYNIDNITDRKKIRKQVTKDLLCSIQNKFDNIDICIIIDPQLKNQFLSLGCFIKFCIIYVDNHDLEDLSFSRIYYNLRKIDILITDILLHITEVCQLSQYENMRDIFDNLFEILYTLSIINHDINLSE